MRISLTGLMLLLVILSGCYNAEKGSVPEPSQPLTIRFGHNWTGRDGKAVYYSGLLEELARELTPDYNLRLETTHQSEYRYQMESQLSSGNAPDLYLFWATEALIRSVVSLGGAVDVREYLEVASEVSYPDFYDYAWEFTTVDETPWAVPIEAFVGFFMVNEKLFEEQGLSLPLNSTEFNRAGARFRDSGYVPLAVSSVSGDPGHLFYSALALQYGDRYRRTMESLSRGEFATPVNRYAAETVEELVDLGFLPSGLEQTGSYQLMASLYNQRRSPMIYTFPWVIQDFHEDVVRESRIIPLPDFAGEGHTRDLIGGVAMALFINPDAWADSKRRPALKMMLDRLLSARTFSGLAQTGMLPARILSREEVNELPLLYRKLTHFIAERIPVPAHEIHFPDSQSLEVYRRGIDQLFSGNLSAEEFIDYVER